MLRNAKGFTLIELLIVVVMIALMLTGMPLAWVTMLLAVGIYPRFVSAVAEVTTLRFRTPSLALLALMVLRDRRRRAR